MQNNSKNSNIVDADHDVLLRICNLHASFCKDFQNAEHSQAIPQDSVKNKSNSVNCDTFCLKNINFKILRGQRLGLAGESGSGKSLLARIILGLESSIKINGNIFFENHDILQMRGNNTISYTTSLLNTIKKFYNSSATQNNIWRHTILGRKISYIPQDTLNSLNPLHKIHKQIEEVLNIHGLLFNKEERKRHINALCSDIGIEKDLLNRYPHELSGGQRQRITICLALVANPKLIICDEPTTALDSHLSFQIVQLLQHLSSKMNIAVLFITHDLGLLHFFCQDSIIMKNGEIVEILKHNTKPKKPYTRNLFEANFLGKKEQNTKPTPIVMKLQNFSVGVKKSNFFKKKFMIITKNVDLILQEGKTLGIIGESGSGKSSLAQGILHLMDTKGQDFYYGKQLSQDGIVDTRYLRDMRKKMQIVFQDSTSSLNPRFRVRDLVSEGLILQNKKRYEIDKEIEKIFAFLNLDKSLLERYPSQLSGGQQQRVAIARSMVLGPKILILDEPTSALDKSIQKATLQLLHDMQKEFNLSYIIITHDLSVAANLCDDIAVMFQGQIVEHGIATEIFNNPKHYYTQQMMKIYHHFNSTNLQ